MRKFNLFKEIITTDKAELLKAINSAKSFGINIQGEIKYAPYDAKEVLIFSGKHTPEPLSALTPPTPIKIENILGPNYQIVEDDDRVLIKAFSNWQEIIGFNMPRCSYDDTTADGVAEFSNRDLEEIGWQATEFDVDYRDLVDELEAKCEGVVICIEQEEPYQFSGLGFIADDKEAYDVLFAYCKNHVQEKLENDPDFAKETLTDDEEEAAEFFGLL